MKRLLVGLLFLSICVAPLYAQVDNVQTMTKTGTTAAQFLKIGVDARSMGMGGAVSGVEGDLSAMHWNPAGLGHIQGLEAMFSYGSWLADMDFNYLAFASNLGGLGVIGISVTSLTMPEEKVRTVEEPEGTGELFDASDLAVGVTYSRQLTDRFSIGGSVKFVHQSIWHMSASTFAADLGALFTTPFKGVRLGATISNFGSNARLEGRDIKFSKDPDDFNEGNVKFVNALYETDAFPLPLLFRVGLAGEVMQSDQLRWTLGVDALNPNDNTGSVNVGTEVALNEMVFLRGGWATLFREYSEEGLTLGAGLHYRIWGTTTLLKIDYAYQDYGLLESVQRFTVGVRF